MGNYTTEPSGFEQRILQARNAHQTTRRHQQYPDTIVWSLNFSWYNCIVLEFLMIILTNFCDGTSPVGPQNPVQTWHWILHVSEARFGNGSRTGNKLYIYTKSIWCFDIKYWTSMAQVEEMLFEKREDPGSNLVVDMNFLHICWMLEVMRFENWLNFQNALVKIYLCM